MRQFNPLHFLDPSTFSKDISNSSSEEPARPVMITGTKRGFEVRGQEDNRVGEITTLHDDYKNRTAPETNIGWMVDVDRNHISGVLGYVKGNTIPSGHRVSYWMYQLNGVWALGKMASIDSRYANYRPFASQSNHSSASPLWRMETVAMSDCSPCYIGDSDKPDMIFPAADWAINTFPRDGVSEEVLNTRLALAEAFYKENFAFLGLQIQSHRRHWGDNPRQAVVERGVEIPKPNYAFAVSGTVSAIQELTAEQERIIRAVNISPSQVNSETAFSVNIDREISTTDPSVIQQVVMNSVRSQRPELRIRGINIDSSSSIINGLKADD